jgi:hypothetical protein
LEEVVYESLAEENEDCSGGERMLESSLLGGRKVAVGESL